MSPAARRRFLATLAALVAAGAAAAPARAQAPLSDAAPTPQAIAAHAEFLAQAPPPPGEPGAVCVVDTGVTPIRDLAGQITERLAVGGGRVDDVQMDPNRIGTGHGTFVASAIASQVDGWGSAGIWPRAKIVSVRVVDEGGEATGERYRTALDECAQPRRRALVINLSLGSVNATAQELRRLEDRIATLRSAGVHVVAGAGNTGDGVTFPGRFAATLAVAATDPADALCSFSSRGPEVDLRALGCSTLLSLPDGRAARFSGTSYAAPAVSAALLALRSYVPHLRAAEAEELLLASSRGGSLDIGEAFRRAGLAGLVDAYAPPQPQGGGAFPVPVRETAPAQPTPSRDIQPLESRSPGATPRARAPRLRSLSFRRGRLTLALRELPAGATARVTVDRRTFVRSSRRFTLRVRRWRRVSIVVEDAWGVRSQPLVRTSRQLR